MNNSNNLFFKSILDRKFQEYTKQLEKKFTNTENIEAEVSNNI